MFIRQEEEGSLGDVLQSLCLEQGEARREPALAREHVDGLQASLKQVLDENRKDADGGRDMDSVIAEVKLLQHLVERHGMDLIVENIETEPDLIAPLDFRIDFGQGYLFGEPRLSQVE